MITKDMSILDIMQKFPHSQEVFKNYGMGCLSCMGAEQETLEAGARMHGIDLDKLMKSLNDLDKNKKQN